MSHHFAIEKWVVINFDRASWFVARSIHVVRVSTVHLHTKVSHILKLHF